MTLAKIFRQTPSFRGKIRLANLLVGREGTNVFVEAKAGKFYLPNLKDNQYFEIYVKGQYEPGLVKYIVDNLPQNGYLLDMGANIGSVAVPVALARPDVKILSIEALPRNYDYLVRNVAANNITNIQTLNACCSNADGLTVKFYHHEFRVGSSSFHSLHSTNFVELVTKTLDRQLAELGIDKIDMIKIDTEGSEGLIFQGARELFRKSKPVVLFEFNESYENAIDGLKAGDAQQFLLDAGYVLYDFDTYPNSAAFNKALLKGSGEFLAIPAK